MRALTLQEVDVVSGGAHFTNKLAKLEQQQAKADAREEKRREKFEAQRAKRQGKIDELEVANGHE